MKTHLPVQRKDLPIGYRKIGSKVVIAPIRIWDQGVQWVVAAGHLHDNQGAIGAGSGGGLEQRGGDGPPENGWHHRQSRHHGDTSF